MEAFGYSAEYVDDPLGWAQTHPESAMLVMVRRSGDADLLVDLTNDNPSVAVIALLDPMSPEHLHLCLGAGARGCASMDWSGQDLALAIDAGRRGLSIIPADAARSLATASTNRNRNPLRSLTKTQLSWLRDLAEGTSVHALADKVGFSEREMYRRLRFTYRKMGCTTRTEALILASRCGLLDRPTTSTRPVR